MNSIHDMGGMHGFGPIPIEEDEPVFHTEWEAKAMALTVAVAAWRKWNLDQSRFARERLSAFEYMQFTYYERWIAGLVNLMVEHDLVSPAELESGVPAATLEPPLRGEDVAAMLARGGPVNRDTDAPVLFSQGQRVRAITFNPEGHTRLPRYARGRSGEIIAHHGAHVLPDSNACGAGEAPEHLYSVRFTARELWGATASPRDSVTLDLWESYLEAIDG